jgi:DNA (cytosine-5)-methyltransferase 1
MSLSIAETFVGCGGSHLGFKSQGFKTVFVNDIWKEALETLKINNTDIENRRIICEDICKLDCNALQNEFPELKELDVLMGGVVCKGFSMAGIRNPFDIRNYLYLEQLRLVENFKPKISVIENVPGMVSMSILKREENDKRFKELDEIYEMIKSARGKKITIQKVLDQKTYKSVDEYDKLVQDLQTIEDDCNILLELKEEMKNDLAPLMYNVVNDIVKRYNELGYNVNMNVLCCADFGGYTTRKRLFIVAIRKDINKEWEWPVPTHSKDGSDGKAKWNTVRDAFNLLDVNGINNPSVDIDNVSMNHAESTIEKFKKITSKKDKTLNKYFSRGTCSRLDFDQCAPTLVPGHSAFQIHPIEHRSITVREGATITGFPTNYIFKGTHSDKCMQIGNAIPLHLSSIIAYQVKKYLS